MKKVNEMIVLLLNCLQRLDPMVNYYLSTNMMQVVDSMQATKPEEELETKHGKN